MEALSTAESNLDAATEAALAAERAVREKAAELQDAVKALQAQRLAVRSHKHELDRLTDAEPTLRGARYSRSRNSILQALDLPRRMPFDYVERTPFDDPAATIDNGILARTDPYTGLVSHIATLCRSGRVVILKSFGGSHEHERYLVRELATLNPAALLDCPGLVRPSAIVIDPDNHERLWLEYFSFEDTFLVSATEYCDDIRSSGHGNSVELYEEARRLCQQALLGLSFMHARGIAHRAICPDNLRISPSGHLLIAGFELSSAPAARPPLLSLRDDGDSNEPSCNSPCSALPKIKINPLASPDTPRAWARTRPGDAERRGSLYAAPEMEREEVVGPASDLWSLGAVLFRLVHGFDYKPQLELPPTGRSVDELLAAMLAPLPRHRPTGPRLLSDQEYFQESTIGVLVREGELQPMGQRRHLAVGQLNEALCNARDYAPSDCFVGLQVRSSHILEDGLGGFRTILSRNPELARHRLWVDFTDGVGCDYGGLTTELYFKLWEAITDTSNGLFEGEGDARLPVATSPDDDEKLDQFHAIGALVAKTLFDGRKASPSLALSLFKFLRDEPLEPTMRDVVAFDRPLATRLTELLTMSPDAVVDLCLEFEREDGTAVAVNGATRHEYLRTMPARVLVLDRLHSLERMRDGLTLGCAILSPPPLEDEQPFVNTLYESLNQLTPSEMRLECCAVDVISPEDVLDRCCFSIGLSGELRGWLCDAIISLTVKGISDFLYFATGAPCLPSATGNNIYFEPAAEASSSVGHLPTSHTCFNRVHIPAYTSFEQLREKLMQAVLAGVEQGGYQMA